MQVADTELWLSEEAGKQAQVQATEEPVMTSSQVKTRLGTVQAAYDKLNSKKRPKPAATPNNSKDTGAAGSRSGGSEGGAST